MAQEQSSFPLKWIIYGALALFFLFRVFSGGSSSGDDYIEETLEEPTQGIHVELQEMESDLFKITDEEILAKREDSQIIVTFLDSTVDTFGIDEIKLMEANDPKRSLIRSAAYAGMFGYMMGRPMGSGLGRSAYASDGAYNKSNSTGRSQLRSTARKTTVRKPSTSSKSYGSSRSTKSYGG